MMPAWEAFSRRVCALLSEAMKKSNTAKARNNPSFIQLGCGRNSQTNIELASDLSGHVFATFEVNDQGLDGIDWTPGNSPPTHHNCEQCPGKTFYNCAFSSTKEINPRRSPERNHKQRYAVVVENKFCSSLQLKLYLSLLHSLDALNLHCIHLPR